MAGYDLDRFGRRFLGTARHGVLAARVKPAARWRLKEVGD
jgi:hypothetical protein